ncbi:hypothetical protein ACSQ67_019122 [Phaseolus vulgaris]
MAPARDNTIVVLVACFVMISAASQTIRPSCQHKCGTVNIPYPFGTREDCYLNSNFYVACNTSHKPPKLFLWNVTKNIEILEVLLNGHLRVKSPVAYVCYDEKGVLVDSGNSSMTLQAFPFSYTQNKFVGVGCDTLSTINATIGKNYSAGGCFSICSSVESSTSGSQFGIGFCQTSIPKNILEYQARVMKSNMLHRNMNIPCSYSLLVEEDSFKFSTDDFIKLQKRRTVPTVLDWAVGNLTCEEAKNNLTSYVCQENSVCIDSQNGRGYLCGCFEGYVGNAYLHGGCHDIDECADPSLNDCSDICINLPGSYNCSCPKARKYLGDGRKRGSGCVSNLQRVVNEIVIGLVLLLFGSGWLYHVFGKRKRVSLTARYFKSNGGLMLQQQISKMEGSFEIAKIFTARELKKATENFHESRIIGRGGYGTVYKGILPNDQLLTGRRALSFDMPEEKRNLALYFLSAVKNDCLFQIVEDCVNEGNSEQVKEVSNIAQWCLRLRGEERPGMKEVAMELGSLKTMTTTSLINATSNGAEYVIGERSGSAERDTANCHYTYAKCAGPEDDAICNDVMSPLWDGR